MLDILTLTKRLALVTVLTATAFLAGCQSELYSSLTERQANEIVHALSEVGISANRTGEEAGEYSVTVDRSNFSTAISELSARGLPREEYQTLGNVFSSDKLVSTPFEERARFMHALNEELSSSISRISGVSSARVHLMVPESSPFDKIKVTPRASVFIYKSQETELNNQIPVIKNLIVNSLDGLLYENVEVAVFNGQGQSAATTGAFKSPASNMILEILSLVATLAIIFFGWRMLRHFKATRNIQAKLSNAVSNGSSQQTPNAGV